MYFDEDVVLDVRLNLLNEHVHKFVIIESIFNHKGEKREPQFNIDKFSKFKEKIIYILKDDVPSEIETIGEHDSKKEVFRKSILNALKRENLQRNSISEGLKDARPDDWIIISDLDEIPKLEKLYFERIKEKILIFEQEMMYYKFNLKLENFTWMGSKACKFKFLESPQWLRNIKGKNYPKWRLDTWFSNKKYSNLCFIKNGGWHFTCLKTAEDLEKKLLNFAHHYEYEESGLNIDGLKKLISEKKVMYDHKVDQKGYKWSGKSILKNYDKNLLPKYVQENLEKYSDWLD